MFEYYKADIQGICERLNAAYPYADYELEPRSNLVVVRFPPGFNFMQYIISNIANEHGDARLNYASYQYKSDVQPDDVYVSGRIRWSTIRSVWRGYSRAQENRWSIICESDPGVIEEILRKILPHVPHRLGASDF